MENSVVVGMSGGVDSSVSAAWLYERGFSVCGATLKLTDKLCEGCVQKTCGSGTDAQQAEQLCRSFGFKHETIDAQDDFFEKVVRKFGNEYVLGRTPNPCVLCNKYIKFPYLAECADRLGYSYIATGHYANVEYNAGTGRYLLKKAANTAKDQTYVLYSLTQEILSRVIFPLGNVMKSDVKQYAKSNDFASADRKESQDICFVKDGDYAGFLKDKLNISSDSGDFVGKDGSVLGKHKGIINYTVGQRKGLGIASAEPYYVVRKDCVSNAVVLGRKEDLFSDSLTAYNLNFISVEKLNGNMRVTAKTRYSQNESAAEISMNSDGTAAVKFDSPQRAVTPGQAVVFYDGDVVVGGGTIL